jgi:hypothetical protein
MSIDVGLDTQTGDLPAFSRHIRAEALAIQRIKTRLRTFLGDWLLDTTVGLPYVEWKQQKPPDTIAIGATVQAEIEATTGVERVDNFDASFEIRSGVDATLLFTGDIVFDPGDEASVEFVAEVLAAGGNSTPAVISFGDVGPVTGRTGGI